MTLRFCTQCGAQNAEDRAQCFACGAELAEPPAAFGPPTGYVRLPAVDEVDEKFLAEFSWGPGCQYYFFSRAMFVLLLATLALGVISGLIGAWTENFDPESLAAEVGMLIGIAAMLIYAGKVARRRRWKGLRWRDFESFRRSEMMWRTLGMIGWGVTILGFIKELFAGPDA